MRHIEYSGKFVQIQPRMEEPNINSLFARQLSATILFTTSVNPTTAFDALLDIFKMRPIAQIDYCVIVLIVIQVLTLLIYRTHADKGPRN